MAQTSFSTLWDGYKDQAHARKARDTLYRALVKKGIPCKRSVLKNQVKQYEDMRGPAGVCDVYYIDVLDPKYSNEDLIWARKNRLGAFK